MTAPERIKKHLLVRRELNTGFKVIVIYSKYFRAFGKNKSVESSPPRR